MADDHQRTQQQEHGENSGDVETRRRRAIPMLATTKIVAALVMPMIVPRSRMTTPAPRKPMPGMIWAAMRV